MFDSETAKILRAAPKLEGLDPDQIPQVLTRHYAQLVSIRLGGEDAENATPRKGEWTLDQIADSYELVASIHSDSGSRRAAAFVAATAQQIITRRPDYISSDAALITRDYVDPAITAALLFLLAEQYADANEASRAIKVGPTDSQVVRVLVGHIVHLAQGNLSKIASSSSQVELEQLSIEKPIEEIANECLMQTISEAIEQLAQEMLSTQFNDFPSFSSSSNWDQKLSLVIDLASGTGATDVEQAENNLIPTYPGPRHLASLLRSASRTLASAALTKVPPPIDADALQWEKWLRYRAEKFPFVWPNHRQVIEQGFYEPGTSAVVVLPTGAGKTTVSSLKIAGVLAAGKKVIFLAPTHALVDQLTEDLQSMFPIEVLGSKVSSDFDLLYRSDTQLPQIEVMTPERCLALLSFSRDKFGSVGLLVFDECHLLSPTAGNLRRALDGMLCILAFNAIAPSADFLFLSAMLANGSEFANWIESLTFRRCISADLLWKPSRQARGVVVYDGGEIAKATESALRVQKSINARKGKKAKNLRAESRRELMVIPFAIWGLRHNWLDTTSKKAAFTTCKISKKRIALDATIEHGPLRVRPNVNSVASSIACDAANSGLKTIVFVNQKSHAVFTANRISNLLAVNVVPTPDEVILWDELEEELGSLKHALFKGPVIAVPHNASMLRLERELSQRMYQRPDGAKVIVATPTLAQGLNLPAQLAILAGDKRADPEDGGRDRLEAHEILNAAARAGRAGHLANGIVLLVPEPPVSFKSKHQLTKDAVATLKSILPEDDRCVALYDPIQVVLDRIQQGEIQDRDVLYTVNRMAAISAADEYEDPAVLFNLKRSYAGFVAKQNDSSATFEAQLSLLRSKVTEATPVTTEPSLATLASQSGLPIDTIARLRSRLLDQEGSLPLSVVDWIFWVIDWLGKDPETMDTLLFDTFRAINAAAGKPKDSVLLPETLEQLKPGIKLWMEGKSLSEVELALGGNPHSSTESKRVCPQARELAGTVMPRGIAYIMSLVTAVVAEAHLYEMQEDLSIELVEILSVAARIGLDSPQKVRYSQTHPHILGRVRLHREFHEAEVDF